MTSSTTMCGVLSPSGYHCTLQEGHSGNHKTMSPSGAGLFALDEWEQKSLDLDKTYTTSYYWQGWKDCKEYMEKEAERKKEFDDSVYEEVASEIDKEVWERITNFKGSKQIPVVGIQSEYGLSLVSGWICPRCKQVNSPLVAHCNCKDED